MRVIFTAITATILLRVVIASGSCTVCDEGTFCFNEVLKSCPANATSPVGSFDFKNCSCNPGYHGETNCDFCGIGYYCPGGSTREICPQHQTTTTKYSSNLEDCECMKGYHLGDGSECVACPAGKYKERPGIHSCTSCPENKYSEVVASISELDCENCPSHTLSAESSDQVTDCKCIPGFFRETDFMCIPCPLGTYEDSGNCVNCAFGSYNSRRNTTSCLPCQENSNTSTDRAMSPTECKCFAGYILKAEDGMYECIACEKGKYEQNGVCRPSPRNTFVNILASFTPTDCPANSTTLSGGAKSIEDCLCGVGFEKSNDKCIQCAVGKFKSSVHASICQLCAPGSFTAKLQSQECTPCAQNTFQPESGGSQCLTCTPNSLSESGASSVDMCKCDAGFAEVDGACVQCGFGFYKASVANQACDQCSPGKSTKERQMVTVTECETCPSDHYSFLNGTDFVCQDCPDFSSSGSGSYNVTQCQCRSGFEFSSEGCRECAMGKYKDQFGNTDCVSCPGGMQGKPDANRRTSISSSCIDCESGKYENNNICESCHSNSASAVKSTAVTDCICHFGFEFNGVYCTACNTGKYKDQQSNSVSCTSCPKGTYNHLLSQSECSLCPGNMTTRETQSQDFSECECDASLGFVSSGSSCHLCSAGSYAKDDSCEQCPAGTYYPTQKPPFLLSRCTSCPSDMYSNNGTFGVDGCVCVAGFTRNTSRSCVPCVVNSYCPSQHKQTPCPPFSENSGGAHSQEQCHCAAGYFGTAATGCFLCEKDNYCTGGETQTKCRLNSTTRGLQGRSDGHACVCNAGFFEDTDLSCTRCPVDSYCFNDSITHCPPNSSAFLKSDSITDCRCSFGLYMHESTCKTCDPSVLCLGGQSDPVSCSTGAFVENGQCVCGKGTYCDIDNLESGCVTPHTCVVCPVGSRCENNERTPCHANSSTPLGSDLSVECVCLDGWYLEQGRCKDCPLHHYCVMDEKAHCLDWDANLRTIDLYNYERTHCECEVGYFRLNYNDTCKPCPKDFYCPKESTQDLPNILACFENEYTEEERSYKRTDCICDAGSKFVSDGPTAKCLPCGEGERCVNGIVQEEFCHIGFRVANSDHSACVCISGFEEGPAKNCRPCATGHVKSVIGDHSCTACAAGSFSVNSTTCLPCDSDRESIEGSSECLCKAPLIEIEQQCHLCEDGFYYHGTPDNATCKACQNFATSIPRADELQQECFCIPGYSMSTQNDCLPCAKDTFWEDGECVSCGVNLQSQEASISRDNCSCRVCTSLNWVGVHECYASCAHNPQNCSACPTGKFKGILSEQGNLDLCQDCALHRYSDEEGLSSCSFCPPTRMTNDVGSTSPDHCRCRPGFTELNATSVENCSMCGLGHFKPIEGNQACTPCADGSFADALGMLECKQCSTHSEVRHANKTYENFGATDVSRCTCAKGYFSDGPVTVSEPYVWMLNTIAGDKDPDDGDKSTDGMGTSALMAPGFLVSWVPPGGAGEVILFNERTNPNLRRVDVATAEVSTVGVDKLKPPGVADGVAVPTKMRVGPDGNTLYVVDKELRSISKMDLAGSADAWALEQWVGAYETLTGEADGQGTNAKFQRILDFDFRPDGSAMIVVERDSEDADAATGVRVKIREVVLDTGEVSTIGLVVTHADERTLLKLDSQSPAGIAVAPDGASVFLAESAGHSIWQVDISTSRTATAPPWGGATPPCLYEHSGPEYIQGASGNCDITATRLAGDTSGAPGHVDGIGTDALFQLPVSLELSPDGLTMVIAEGGNPGAIRLIDLSTLGVTTLAGQLQAQGYVDGAASVAKFHTVTHVIYGTSTDTLYVADNKVIRELHFKNTFESSSGTSNVCSPCVTGSFKHEKGFQECFFCGDTGDPYGFNFANFYGRDEVAAISTAHCIECPENSGQDDTQVPEAFIMNEIEDCLCYPGHERKSQDITSGCAICDNYMFKVGYNNQNCSFCSQNEFYINRLNSCDQCQLMLENSDTIHSFAANRLFENITWGIDQQDCVCDVGYHRNDLTEEARCIACTPGHYRNDIMNDPRTLCLACPLNQYSDETATVYCSECPLNSFTYDTGSTDVDNCRCSAGFEWSDTHSTCNACPPGKFKASDDTVSERYECLQCADGTFSDGNASTSCQLCGDNMHSTLPRDGVERCECDPGFGGAPCTTCAIGSYSGGGTSDDQHKACQACPDGKTTFSNTSKYIQQCACLPGYGISPGTDPLPEHTCIICEDGYYATGLTNVPCTHCGLFGVTEPELGATHFDACMCNHEIGVFETEYLL